MKRGKTPVLRADEARTLLDSIQISRKKDGTEIPDIIGLRDRALIAVMVYSFARVGAALSMRVEDYYTEGRRGGFGFTRRAASATRFPPTTMPKPTWMPTSKPPASPRTERAPLFRPSTGPASSRAADGPERRSSDDQAKSKDAGLSPAVCCHTFRATGITAYLENGGTIEKAQQIAAHESPKTTKLYDRTRDQISLDEIERIAI